MMLQEEVLIQSKDRVKARQKLSNGPRIASRSFVTRCLTNDVTATLTFGGVCQNILLILSQPQSDAEGGRSSALN